MWGKALVLCQNHIARYVIVILVVLAEILEVAGCDIEVYATALDACVNGSLQTRAQQWTVGSAEAEHIASLHIEDVILTILVVVAEVDDTLVIDKQD